MTQRFVALGWAKRGFILIALGVVIGLGHAPLNWWWASVIGLAVAFALTRSATNMKTSFWHGWALGLGYFGFSLRWIISPFLVHVERDGWMAPFAVVLMAGGFALFWGLAAALSHGVFKSHTLAFPLCLAGVEVLRSLILTGFPWALLGHVLVPTFMAQTAALGGPHLLTMIVVLLALSLAAMVTGHAKRGVAGLIGLPVLGLAVTIQSLSPTFVSRPIEDRPVVRLIQPNAPQDEKWDIDKRHVFFDRMLGFTGEGDVPDLVVWPESSIPVLLHYADPELELVSEAARGAPVIVGVNRAQEGLYHNSFILLGRGGRIDDIYDKQHLVPFGEYVPGGDLLHKAGIEGFGSSYGGGFTPGSGKRTIDVPGIGAVRPLICYEGIFAEEVGGTEERPQAMVLITNDAWFGKDAGPFQHLAQAQLRAIEQGIPMVRVANTGVSAMIDARGQVTASIPLNTAGYVDARLPVPLPPTQYSKTGDWPVLTLLALMLGALGFTRRSA